MILRRQDKIHQKRLGSNKGFDSDKRRNKTSEPLKLQMIVMSFELR